MSASLEVLKFIAGDVVAPDAYTRLLDRLSKRSERNKLCGHVRKSRGKRVDRRYRSWLKQSETRALLEKRSRESRDQLIISLTEARSKSVFRQRTPEPAVAEELVDATFLFFLQSMGPSNAVAVSDARNEARFGLVEEAIRERTGFEDALGLLPPQVRQGLREASLHERDAAERLAYAVAHGDPVQVLGEFSTLQPEWLRAAPGSIQLALAEMQRVFGLSHAAAASYERAAELGFNTAESLAVAASLLYAVEQNEEADTLIARARLLGSSALVEVVATAEADPSKLPTVLTAEEAGKHRLSALLYAQGLCSRNNLRGAVDFLRQYLGDKPNDTEAAVLLARTLTAGAALTTRGETNSELNEALELALNARDERRRWRLPSGAAAAAACHAQLVRGWLEEVLVLGQTPPRGEATKAEAANPEVQFAVSQAAFALGDHDIAGEVASRSDGFDKALLQADLAVAAGEDPAAAAQLYEQAWAAAANDRDRHSLWVSAANAGIEPLPGADQLPEDDFGTVIRGMLHIARGRPADAVDLLRPLRGDVHARATLTQAYLNLERVDEAVSELLDMAELFQRVEYRVRACEVLRRNGRLADAAELAKAALTALMPGHPSRTRMYELLAADAEDREDWHGLDQWARTWIAECGPSPGRLWIRAASLHNLGDTAGAWQVLTSNPELESETPGHARLWIALGSLHDPGEETRKRALALAQAFSDQRAVRNSAVNAFFLMGDARGAVPADEQQQWQRLIDERAEDDDPDDYFEAIRVQSAEDLIDHFRVQLEGQAQRVAEWLPKVRDEGYPFGFLSQVTGRHYAQTLVGRGSEFLSVAGHGEDQFAREVAAAEQALDRTVAVDTSTLVVGYLLDEEWATLLASFTRVIAPRALRVDAAASLAALRPDATTQLSWDLSAGTMVASEIDPGELVDQVDQLQWVCDQAAQLPAAAAAPQDEHPVPEMAWTQSVLVSVEEGCALWADDLGVRLLAEAEGVDAFGTWALLAALERRGRISPEGLRAAGWKLRDNYCADLPLDSEWVVASGAANGWRGPEVSLFTRPATWAAKSAYRVWADAVSGVAQVDENLVPSWVYAATIGVLRELKRRLGRPPSLSEGHAASIPVLHMVATTGFNPPLFASTLSLVRTACAQMEVPDMTAFALVELAERMRDEMGMEEGNTALARLGSALEGDHQDQLRRVLFELDGDGRPARTPR